MKEKTLKVLMIVLIIVSVIGIDQISKHIVRENVEYNSRSNVVGEYLILTKIENTGAFLGMGDSIPRPLFVILMIVLPLVVMGYAFYYIIKTSDLSKLLQISISLIIGGGIGNIIDRILYGSVTDFLYFDFVLFHTGIVNMADIAVTTGFFILLFDAFFNKQSQTEIKG
jgi:signal peptidase II